MESGQLRRYTTHRLDLIASTLDHLLAELESTERFAAVLGVEVGPGWPPGEYDRNAIEFFRDRLLEGGEEVVGWYGWYAVRRASVDLPAVLVAACGFFGPPEERGEVEIGYSVVASFRRQGYATEIVHALVDIAFSDPGVQRVVARTTQRNIASISTLKRAGFIQATAADGEGIIRFELARASSPHNHSFE